MKRQILICLGLLTLLAACSAAVMETPKSPTHCPEHDARGDQPKEGGIGGTGARECPDKK